MIEMSEDTSDSGDESSSSESPSFDGEPIQRSEKGGASSDTGEN